MAEETEHGAAKGPKEKKIQRMAQESGKSAEEVNKMVEQKKEKFSGILDEDSAIFMVARELGVGVVAGAAGECEAGAAGTGEAWGVQKRGHGQAVKIGELQDGMQNLDLNVVVKHVFAPRKFEKGGKKGRLMNLVVADASGETRLTLWNEDAKKFESAKIERGAVLGIRGCYVKEWQEKPQLNLSYSGGFEIFGDGIAGAESGEIVEGGKGADCGAMPGVDAKPVKLSALKDGMQNVDAYVRIVRKFETREFEREGKRGAVMNFMVGDETATVRATAWNEMVGVLHGLAEGRAIKVEGAYTKPGMRGVELHLGWLARVIEEPVGVELPTAKEIGAGAETDAGYAAQGTVETIKIGELKEGFVGGIKGKVAELQPGNLHYLVCPKCGKKVERLEDGFACNACGEVKTPEMRLLLGFVLEEADGSAKVRCVAFGDVVEKVIGAGRKEVGAMLDAGSAADALEILGKKAVGKEIALAGRAKTNDFSNEIEFVCNAVV